MQEALSTPDHQLKRKKGSKNIEESVDLHESGEEAFLGHQIRLSVLHTAPSPEPADYSLAANVPEERKALTPFSRSKAKGVNSDGRTGGVLRTPTATVNILFTSD